MVDAEYWTEESANVTGADLVGLRIVICDDHRVLREALERFLRGQPGVREVKTTSSPDEVIRFARAGIDVLILDVALGDREEEGFEVLEALRNLGLRPPTLALGATNDPTVIAHALLLGATGFVGKQEHPDQLLAAVRKVASGETTLPSDIAPQVLRSLQAQREHVRASMALLGRLTPREREIVRLLASGHSRQDIAVRLQLSHHTVRTHLNHAMSKLGVHSQLMAAAVMREAMETLSRSASAQDGNPPRA